MGKNKSILENLQIIGDDGTQHITFHLKDNQVIIGTSESLLYTKGTVTVEEYKFPYCKFQSTNGGTIAFGKNNLNSIATIEIKEGESFRIYDKSMIASTENIVLCEDTAKCIRDDSGYIWLSANGAFQKIQIDVDDELNIRDGIFLACASSLKSVKTDFGMIFKGTGIVLIQTKVEEKKENRLNSLFQNILKIGNVKNEKIREKLRNI